VLLKKRRDLLFLGVVDLLFLGVVDLLFLGVVDLLFLGVAEEASRLALPNS
jgi:hypothetical protein